MKQDQISQWADDIFAAIALVAFILIVYYGLGFISHGAHIALGVSR